MKKWVKVGLYVGGGTILGVACVTGLGVIGAGAYAVVTATTSITAAEAAVLGVTALVSSNYLTPVLVVGALAGGTTGKRIYDREGNNQLLQQQLTSVNNAANQNHTIYPQTNNKNQVLQQSIQQLTQDKQNLQNQIAKKNQTLTQVQRENAQLRKENQKLKNPPVKRREQSEDSSSEENDLSTITNQSTSEATSNFFKKTNDRKRLTAEETDSDKKDMEEDMTNTL